MAVYSYYKINDNRKYFDVMGIFNSIKCHSIIMN